MIFFQRNDSHYDKNLTNYVFYLEYSTYSELEYKKLVEYYKSLRYFRILL